MTSPLPDPELKRLEALRNSDSRDLAKRKQAEEERDRLFNLSLDLLCVANFEGRLEQVNPAWTECLGWTAEELTSCPMQEFIHPDDREATTRTRETIIQGNPMRGFENRYRCRDGSYRWLSWNVYPLSGTRQVFAVARDVTEQKLAEVRIQRLNRLYAVSSGINEAIVRIRVSQELYQQACRIVVERGGLVMAWVALAEAGDTLTPVAHWGRNDGYLDLLRLTTNPDLLEGRGPAGQAFRSGSPAYCNDIEAATESFVSRTAALQRGYRSCAVFPLKVEGLSVGILAVYGDQPGYFGEEEMQLLNGLAENLSFAIESQQREQRRLKAEAALSASEATMAAAQRIGHFGSWEMDLTRREDVDAVPLHWSDEMFRIAGIEPGSIEATYGLFYQLVHPDDHEAIRLVVKEAIRGKRHYSLVHRLIRPDGEERILHETAQIFFDGVTGAPLRMVGNSHDITEQRRAEETLRESEQRFRLLAENIGEVFWITDPAENRILYISPAYEEIWGRSCESLYQSPRSLPDAVHPDDRVRYNRAVARQIAGEYDVIYRIVRPDGEIRWIQDRAYPVRNDQDEIYRIVGTAKDISRRKQTEIALHASEERYRRLFEQNPQPMWVYDRETLQFLAVNDTAVAHYGYSREEFLAMTIADIREPEDVPALRQSVAESGSGLMPPTIWRHRLKDGSVIQVEISSHALVFAGRQARIVLSQNITERLLAEKRIREQATLLDKAQDAIIVRDLDHRILYWNRSAERLYHWTADEAIGASIQELLYRGSRDFLIATDATLDNGEWVGEIEHHTKYGKTLVVEGRWTLVRDENGEPKSILAIYSDVTERKKLEQQFLRAQRMESIGTLAGGIAHDLNNVLAPILMSIDLLKLSLKDQRSLEILSMIGTSARRGADMVSQVLSYARGMEGRRVQVRIHSLVTELAKIAGETFPKNIRIESILEPDLWTLDADPTQLHQVLLNLCVNARDAMPNGGRITIRVCNQMIDGHYAAMNLGAQVGPHVRIEVVDTGTGMSRELINSIFDPFFTTKDVGQGTGLGLSTVLAIIKGHGGFIQVESESGAGSRFRIFLPATGRTTPEEVRQHESKLPRGNGETVLIVDDEASIRKITRETLEAFGYQVFSACDGAEAVSLYVEHRDRIDVVLTDMMMPIMDGPSLIKVLRRLEPDLRIIGASGIAAGSMVAQSMQAGVKQFLPKPYSAEILLGTLKAILTDAN
jgi:PAS domain S-box-containing protein